MLKQETAFAKLLQQSWTYTVVYNCNAVELRFPLIQTKGVFTPNLFGLVQINSSAFAYLLWFIWVGVKAYSRTLVQTKQPGHKRLKRYVSVCFLLTSVTLRLWCKSKTEVHKRPGVSMYFWP